MLMRKKPPSHSIAVREADDFRGRSRRTAITPLAVFLRSSAASDDRFCSFAREACLDAALPDAEDDEDKRPPIPDGGSSGRDSAAAMMALASESAATGGSYSSMSSSWNDGPAERLGLLAYGIGERLARTGTAAAGASEMGRASAIALLRCCGKTVSGVPGGVLACGEEDCALPWWVEGLVTWGRDLRDGDEDCPSS